MAGDRTRDLLSLAIVHMADDLLTFFNCHEIVIRYCRLTNYVTIRCGVIAFLSADTSRDLVTLSFDLLTLNSCHTWRVTWPTLPPILKSLRLFDHELRVITLPIVHWKCERGHCACAESRDPWVGGQKQLHIWNPWPRFADSLYNFYWATTTIKGRLLSSVTNAKALDCVNLLCVTLWPWPLTFFDPVSYTHLTLPTTPYV